MSDNPSIFTILVPQWRETSGGAIFAFVKSKPTERSLYDFAPSPVAACHLLIPLHIASLCFTFRETEHSVYHAKQRPFYSHGDYASSYSSIFHSGC